MDEREPQQTSQTDQRLEHRGLFLRTIRRRIAHGDSYVLVLGTPGEALSVLLGHLAGQEDRVVRFRAEVLQGKLLSLEEIADWVERQAALDGPPTNFMEIVLPAGTAYHVDEGTASIRFDPPVTLALLPPFFLTKDPGYVGFRHETLSLFSVERYPTSAGSPVLWISGWIARGLLE